MLTGAMAHLAVPPSASLLEALMQEYRWQPSDLGLEVSELLVSISSVPGKICAWNLGTQR